MGQIKLTTSVIFIALFTIAILGFTINFAIDNDSAINLADDPEMVSLYSKEQGNLSGFNDGAGSTYNSILDTTVSPDSGTAQSTAPFAITWANILPVTSNIMLVGYRKVFGTGTGFALFINTFLGILVFMAGFYLYKTLSGNPD